jgi:biuret amidohydrolase
MELQRGVVGDLSAFPELAAEVERLGLVMAVNRLLRAARARDVTVVHCIASFRPDRRGSGDNAPLLTAMLRRPDHMVEGGPGVELVASLETHPTDITSARANGVAPFGGSGLDSTLRALRVDTVVAVGVSVNLALFGLAVEAVGLGYNVVLPTDAIAGVPADYAADVIRHSLRLVARLTTVDDIVAAWG